MDKNAVAQVVAKVVVGIATAAAVGATYKNAKRIDELVAPVVDKLVPPSKD